ncbi:MAG: carboxypeptidase regulatory-like domain-containing protein, partial [Sedimentisphaerales bacterium]|nr:carboxypeptidase regulatory-like domain-containing protein [Sedimentisphaerales bacterium]
MIPAGEIERRLHGLEDHTSAAFDERVLHDMFGAQDAAVHATPARSWRHIGRKIMNSRITRYAAAAVLLATVLLLAQHLIGRESMTTPDNGDRTVAGVPGDQGGQSAIPAIEENEQLRLARESDVAAELFAKSDTEGLLRLLDTGLDRTKMAVADYLGRLGDESALPALQRLADQWRGPAEENPFLKSVEQIQKASPGEQDAAPQGPSTDQTLPVGATAVPDGPYIMVRVMDKATGKPIPQAAIRIFAGESRMDAADDDGVFVLDFGSSVPGYVNIFARPEGYVWQVVALRDLKRESLPKTILFSLDKGIAIGGVVRDSEGRPIEGASVESHISEEQQFEQPHVGVSIETTTDAQGRWRSGASVPPEVGRLWFNVRHPDFADDGFEMPGDLKFDDLKAERAVMVLEKGIGLAGRVTDAAGKPIVGARLLAGEDYFARDWTQTDESGHFQFLHLRPLNQSFLLTVQASGFVPQRRELPSEKNLAPADFVLAPAKLLIGRVVDTAGKPIKGAFIC